MYDRPPVKSLQSHVLVLVKGEERQRAAELLGGLLGGCWGAAGTRKIIITVDAPCCAAELIRLPDFQKKKGSALPTPPVAEEGWGRGLGGEATHGN